MLIQKWELPKYSHQDVTLQVHNNPKVTEITSFFRTSFPPHDWRGDTFYQVKAATAAV